MVETSACKALEVLGPKGAQFRCRGYDVVQRGIGRDWKISLSFWDHNIIEFWGPDIYGWDGWDGWMADLTVASPINFDWVSLRHMTSGYQC